MSRPPGRRTRGERLRSMRESLLMATRAIRASKMRSFLTILGVFIGVSSVIAMASCIEGLNRSMARQIQSLGSETIRVRRFKPGIQVGSRPDSLRNRRYFTVEDAEAIKRTAPAVGEVSILMVDGDRVRYRSEETSIVQLIGSDVGFPAIQNMDIHRGRFFTHAEIDHRVGVCVLGQDLVDVLFPGIDPIGRWVTAKGQKLQVIGTFARRGRFLGQSLDDFLVFPYTTFEKLVGRGEWLVIDAKPESPERMTEAIQQITESLRRTRGLPPHKGNDFEIMTSDTLMDTYNQVTGAVYMVMLLISSIALMVGGIGVMNIMLVAVTERTREIGIRKAIGARRSDILWQFLIEAMTLTGLGGVLGILFGAGLGQLVRALTPLPSFVPPVAAIAGFTFSVGIGLFFGIWPAVKAARLNPVDALRYE